jgi:predicted dithiol-disulfide oxidoreductase (DUF899 family)
MNTTESKTSLIDFPPAVSREEWLQARVRLLSEEKELTRARDRVNARRRELPMVKIDREYRFEGPDGESTLLQLFDDQLQLIVYHFMWMWEDGQPRDEPCKGCAGFADELGRGVLNVLRSRHTRFVLVSRAPYAKIEAFKRRMGWDIPWYSSAGSMFNYDFGVLMDPKLAEMRYNYRSQAEHEKNGTGYYFTDKPPFDLPGLSCFLRRDDEVFHTYSTYGRGLETTLASLQLLDFTALGRQEAWEEPKARAAKLVAEVGPPPKFPDEYEYERW